MTRRADREVPRKAGYEDIHREGRQLFSDPRKVGDDPDYRFSLANERTFLAWIRTSLALIAGGLAIVQLLAGTRGWRLIGTLLMVAGGLMAVNSYPRWAEYERAIRLGKPLPTPRSTILLSFGVGLLMGLMVLFVLIEA